MPKISIIIPIYNCEKYLEKCLNSVKEQTFTDFEVLCVDDGSTDGSAEIIKKYANLDDRFKFIKQANSGASMARNKGLKNATGEFIMFLDADDWYEVTVCEKAYNAITTHNADVALFSGIWEYKNNSVVNHALSNEEVVFLEDGAKTLRRKTFGLIKDELYNIVKIDYLSLLYLKIYRADIIKNNGLEIPDIKKTGSFEDGLFNIYYFKYVKKAVYTGIPLYHYRKDNDASITTRYNKNLKEQWQYLFSEMRDIIAREDLDESFVSALNNRIAYSILGIGSNFLNAPLRPKEIRKKIKEYLVSQDYQKAIKSFSIKHVSLIWKPLFIFCKIKCTFGVYLMLKIIKKIRKNKNS